MLYNQITAASKDSLYVPLLCAMSIVLRSKEREVRKEGREEDGLPRSERCWKKEAEVVR